jgi:N-acylglucosamine 2-epimerase
MKEALALAWDAEHGGLLRFVDVHDQRLERTVREWIQIRDRAGRPLQKVVALPVKDPFHIMRCFMLAVERAAPASVGP